jgi:hypothetical protein
MATQPMDTPPQEPTSFTNTPSDKPWVLTPADAEAVIASWDDTREPSEELKAAFQQYEETVRQA